MKDLSDAFEAYRYGENSRLWLINSQGDIYLSDTLQERDLNISHFIPEHVANMILSGISEKPSETHVMEYEDKEGNLKDLISYPISSTNWHILYQIDREETTSFLKSAKLNTFIATLISIISVIFIFHFISHYLANPFKRAVQINQELENNVVERTRELAEKNQALLDSIDYAKRIRICSSGNGKSGPSISRLLSSVETP